MMRYTSVKMCASCFMNGQTNDHDVKRDATGRAFTLNWAIYREWYNLNSTQNLKT